MNSSLKITSSLLGLLPQQKSVDDSPSVDLSRWLELVSTTVECSPIAEGFECICEWPQALRCPVLCCTWFDSELSGPRGKLQSENLFPCFNCPHFCQRLLLNLSLLSSNVLMHTTSPEIDFANNFFASEGSCAGFCEIYFCCGWKFARSKLWNRELLMRKSTLILQPDVAHWRSCNVCQFAG